MRKAYQKATSFEQKGHVIVLSILFENYLLAGSEGLCLTSVRLIGVVGEAEADVLPDPTSHGTSGASTAFTIVVVLRKPSISAI